MHISEIKVFPIGEEKLKAFVSIVFDDCFMVNDIKVIQGKDGLFISMPSRRKKNGKFKDIAHPLNSETRQDIEGQILRKYRGDAADGESAEEPSSARTDSEAQLEQQRSPNSAVDRGRVDSESEKTLDEVAEIHLQDSFWTG